MEVLYRKKENGRYEKAGYIGIPDIHDGVWLVTSAPGVKTKSNVLARLDDIPTKLDLKKLVQCVALEEIVMNALERLEKTGIYCRADVARDICQQIYKELEKDDKQ